MKKLLSLPPNLVDSFYKILSVDDSEWFCTSDPVGKRLGSGGGTTWLLESCRRHENPSADFNSWISGEKRILLHAGGQSRRLPSYAPSGKILTPIPVFRWARGQKLSQTLLDLQLPLYEQIMNKAPEKLRTMIVSGDVYIRSTAPLQDIPDADVVCYGLWVDPILASRHGVFFSRRETPEVLDFVLQKPSVEKLSSLAETHLFLMDIGIWILSDKAVNLLARRSYSESGEMREYDLYSDFGQALGSNPTLNNDEEINSLKVVVLPLPGGEFYHYGTSRELISSTLAVQNLVRDQRAIMLQKVKPHPAMFVQNAELKITLTPENSELWIENSFISEGWKLSNKHIITGVPENNWTISLGSGICVDVVPMRENEWVARPYGFNDMFKGALSDDSTLWMGKSVSCWAKERNVALPDFQDLQNAPIFPICNNVDDLGKVLRWMISEPDFKEGASIWQNAEKVSANTISDTANLLRLVAQREKFRRSNWTTLAANHSRSVFYQLDLSDAASAFAKDNIALPELLDSEPSLMKRIHNHAFRAKVQYLKGENGAEEQNKAFSLLREGLVGSVIGHKQRPYLNVYSDQIVWGRSPVRIDLAGGWTDTPPFCMYSGGNVVNVAVELNGQQPLQVYVKPASEPCIILRSIDLGAMEVVRTFEELNDYNKVGSPFSIPKAALSLAGFSPMFAEDKYNSLTEALKAFGCGIEITLLAAIPAGSGLGTSSILASTVLGALSDFCGLGWDKNEIGYRTLILEQLLTTGGGWQDQYGGILHGLKLLQTSDGFNQNPLVRWLPEYLFTDPVYRPCHLLFYTGITRTAKGILAEIVQGMFLNSQSHLFILSEMKSHALDMFEAIQRGDFDLYGKLVAKSWSLNKALDSGTNPPSVEAIIEKISDYCLGYKLPGAGGGGYLYMTAKDQEAAARIRRILTENPPNDKARFVEMSLSESGMQVSRS